MLCLNFVPVLPELCILAFQISYPIIDVRSTKRAGQAKIDPVLKRSREKMEINGNPLSRKNKCTLLHRDVVQKMHTQRENYI